MAKITARLARADHPNGQMNRAGVTWTREWLTVDGLSADQIKAVRNDPNLEVKTKAHAADDQGAADQAAADKAAADQAQADADKAKADLDADAQAAADQAAQATAATTQAAPPADDSKTADADAPVKLDYQALVTEAKALGIPAKGKAPVLAQAIADHKAAQ